MANNNENKILNVPNLRFPEFTGEWKQSLLKEYLVENKERNTKGVFSKAEVLSVSGDKGIVNQIELLGRSYAGQSVLPYHIVRRNNIVYTKSPLSEFPYGIVKMNRGNDGIVSTLYAVYSVQETAYPSFIEYYFASKDRTNRYFKPIVRIGAKHDMKIGNGEVLANMVRFPSIKEQRRISEFLELIDKRIATQNKIIDKLQSLISGIIQNAIQKGLNDNTWEMIYLSKLLTERKEKNSNGYEVNSVSVSEGVINQIEYLGRSFAASDTSKYNVVRYGDIVYTKSPTGNFPYGIIKQSFQKHPVAVSPLYGVYEPYSNEAGCFLHYYFLSSIVTTNYLSPLIQKGAKNTINISNQTFLNNMVPYPKEEVGIRPIAELLRKVQIKLNIERLSLVLLEQQKTYLSQSMFI